MQFITKYFSSPAFVLLFITYALSPVSVIYADDRAGSNIHAKGKVTPSAYLKDRHNLFGELIRSKRLHTGGRDRHEIIVKKARSIGPEDRFAKLAQLKNIAIIKQDFTASSPQNCSRLAFVKQRQSVSRGFHSLCSGLSPPAA